MSCLTEVGLLSTHVEQLHKHFSIYCTVSLILNRLDNRRNTMTQNMLTHYPTVKVFCGTYISILT